MKKTTINPQKFQRLERGAEVHSTDTLVYQVMTAIQVTTECVTLSLSLSAQISCTPETCYNSGVCLISLSYRIQRFYHFRRR